ncbi:MAG: hypothetical protein JWO44_1002 [Bacteroidetes bacterium]|nr:hypothetical protein [Bacteroidota bacterium]
MKKITFLKLAYITVVAAAPVTVFSQPVFQKTYASASPNEKGEFAGPASGGGIIICGKTANPPYDAIVMKTDNSGAIQWSKKLVGSGEDVLSCIRPTSDGGYIATGFTTSSGAGGADLLLVKFTGTGTVSWSKTYGTTTDDGGFDVRQTTDGGYIVTGEAKNSSSVSTGAIYLLKTDGTGVLTWSNMWGTGLGNQGRTVIQTSDGGYFLAANGSNGFFYSIKTTSAGVVSWSRATLPTAMSSGSIQQAIQTADGGYALFGNTIASSDNNINMALVKLNSTGVVQFWKTYGGVGIDFGMGIQEMTGGGFLAVGYTASFGTFSDMMILKIGATGTLTSAKTTSYIGSSYDGMFLSKTSDNLYTYASMRNDGVYLFKGDASGITGCTLTTAASTDNAFTGFFDNNAPITASGTTITTAATYTAAALTLTTTTLCSSVVGIEEEMLDKYISVYPNPANSSIEISLDEQLTKGAVEVKIYDLFGRLLSTKSSSAVSGLKLDVQEIPSGIYLLTILADDHSYSKRVVIEH